MKQIIKLPLQGLTMLNPSDITKNGQEILFSPKSCLGQIPLQKEAFSWWSFFLLIKDFPTFGNMLCIDKKDHKCRLQEWLKNALSRNQYISIATTC